MSVGECGLERTEETISLLVDFVYCSCQAVQNLGLALISMVTGLIVDHYGFLMLEIFFIIWLAGEWRGDDRMVAD